MLAKVLTCARLSARLPDEVVITDDGSSVDIPAALGDVSSRLPIPVYFVTQADRGFRAAKCRNNGIRQASGDFLVFADQDIVFTPDYLSIFAENARAGRFLVGYPVRLTEAQTKLVDGELLERGGLLALPTPEQRAVVVKQHRKDGFYALLKKLHLRRIGPKLRSGVFGAFKADLLKVNGFDEAYQGWGNEDDDLGLRLHGAGVSGVNPFCAPTSFHLYHPPHHAPGVRANREYYLKRLDEISRGAYRATHGVETPLGYDIPTVTLLNPEGGK